MNSIKKKKISRIRTKVVRIRHTAYQYPCVEVPDVCLRSAGSAAPRGLQAGDVAHEPQDIPPCPGQAIATYQLFQLPVLLLNSVFGSSVIPFNYLRIPKIGTVPVPHLK